MKSSAGQFHPKNPRTLEEDNDERLTGALVAQTTRLLGSVSGGRVS
jgi:hypothetical protein